MAAWNNLLFDLQNSYYTLGIMWLCELVGIIAGLIFLPRQKLSTLFLLYLIFDFSILNTGLYLKYVSTLSTKEVNRFVDLSNLIISLLELFVYYYFFLQIFKTDSIRKALKAIFLVFLITITAFLISDAGLLDANYLYTSQPIGAIEYIFLLIPCIHFLVILLNTNSKIDLFERPSFWIVSGIFFYSVLSIPYHLIESFLLSNNHQYRHVRKILSAVLFYVPISMNLVFLTKAFLCKKALTI